MQKREKYQQLKKLYKYLDDDGSHPAIRALIVKQHGEMLDLIDEIRQDTVEYQHRHRKPA